MAIVRVQSKTGNIFGASAFITLDSTPVNGNTLIAICARDTGLTPPVATSVVQTGATWNRIHKQTHINNEDTHMEVWVAQNVSGAGTQVTFNNNGSSLAVIVIEYSGVVATGAFIDGMASDFGQGVTPALSGIGQTTQADAAVLSFFAMENGSNIFSAPTNGFSIVDQVSTGSGTAAVAVCTTERILASPTTGLGTQLTATNTDQWMVFQLALVGTNPPIGRVQHFPTFNDGSGVLLGISGATSVQFRGILPNQPVQGNVLVAVCGRETTQVPVAIQSIFQPGVSWARMASRLSSGDIQAEIWVGKVGAGASQAIDVWPRQTTVQDLAVVFMEYSGVHSIGNSLDGIPSTNEGLTTTPSVGPVTSTLPPTVFVGAIVSDHDSSSISGADQGAPSNNYSLTTRQSSEASLSASALVSLVDKTVLAPSAESVGLTLTNANDWATCLIALSAAPITPRVQHGSNGGQNVSSVTANLQQPPAAENALVVMVAVRDSGGGAISVDAAFELGTLGSWSLVAHANPGNNNARALIFLLPNVPVTSHTGIRINLPTNTDAVVTIVEYSGRDISPFRAAATILGNSAIIGTGSIAAPTGSPNEIHVGVICQHTGNTGWTVPASNYVTIQENFDNALVPSSADLHAGFYDFFAPTPVIAGTGVASSTGSTYAGAVIALTVAPVEADRTHTSDALLKTIQDQQHTSDALLKATFNKTHTTDSLLLAGSSVLHSADSYLKAVIDVVHTSDMFIKPPERIPTLRRVLINNVPPNLRSGQFDVKILGIHGNAIAPGKFTYTLPPQEFILARSSLFKLDIVDPIVKKVFESTELPESLQAAVPIPLDNLVFEGFPSVFQPGALAKEEFVVGWTDFAKMSDDNVEEGFEEPEVAWNDPGNDGWTIGEINPDTNLSPSFLEFSIADIPGVGVKNVEDTTNFYKTNPVNIVQVTGNFKSAGGGNPHLISLPTPPTPGNILILAINGGGREVTAVVSTGTTWNISTLTSGSSRTAIAIGYDVQVGASPNISVTMFADDWNGSFIIAEYSGLLSGVGVIDKSQLGSGVGASTMIITQTAPVVQPVQLWVAAFGTTRFDTIFSSYQFGFSVAFDQTGNSLSPTTGTHVALAHKFHQQGMMDADAEASTSPSSDFGISLRTLNTV